MRSKPLVVERWWHFGYYPFCWRRYSDWFVFPRYGRFCFPCEAARDSPPDELTREDEAAWREQELIRAGLLDPGEPTEAAHRRHLASQRKTMSDTPHLLSRAQITCCDDLAQRGGRVDDAEIRRLCTMALAYLDLCERLEAKAVEWDLIIGGEECAEELRALRTPPAGGQ